MKYEIKNACQNGVILACIFMTKWHKKATDDGQWLKGICG